MRQLKRVLKSRGFLGLGDDHGGKNDTEEEVAKAAAPTARRIDKWAKGKGVSRNAAMRQLIEKSLGRA